MKNLFLLMSLFFVNSIVSQNEIKYQDLNTEDLEHVYNRFDRVVKVEISHDNGELYQKGDLKNNKLHGRWESYDIDGNLAEEDRESPHMEQSCVAREGISDVVLSLEAVYAETRRY